MVTLLQLKLFKNQKKTFYLALPIFLFLVRGRFVDFLKKILCIFREGKGGRKRGKHQCVVASCTPRTRGLAHNPGMSPDWESNRRPFGSQAGTQSTEPHQPGPHLVGLNDILELVDWFKKFSFIDLKEREGRGERETFILLFDLFMCSLVDSCMCPDRNGTCSLGVLV